MALLDISTRIELMSGLGTVMKNDLTSGRMEEILVRARNENPWFTEDNCRFALNHMANDLLTKSSLEEWVSKYDVKTSAKSVGLVMAGNIPLVGFHDLMSVFLAGKNALVKMSSKDSVLMKYVLSSLNELEPQIEQHITTVERLVNYDAIVATGSNNSARYFEQYFGHVPHIIRKNRNSVAVLRGDETEDELELLGSDIFHYYGLGCRNVNNLLVVGREQVESIISHFGKWESIKHHHKYFNNYEYYKSIYLINQDKHWDSGFALFRPTDDLISPVAVINLHFFDNVDQVKAFIDSNIEHIQCVVGADDLAISTQVGFGQSQMPGLMDYADGVDTMAFLESL